MALYDGDGYSGRDSTMNRTVSYSTSFYNEMSSKRPEHIIGDMEYRLRQLETQLYETRKQLDDGVVIKGWLCPLCDSVLAPTEKRCNCSHTLVKLK